MIVTNWLGKMIGLPNEFLHNKDSNGGGVIQTTASESTLISLLSGRSVTLQRYSNLQPDVPLFEIHSKLVAYCSDQAHSSVEKAALIGLVTLRYVESDAEYSMSGSKLLEAVKEDREKGLIPFWVCTTLGTTGCCSFDDLQGIANVCQQEQLWCHVDAAYAGCSFICPEFRKWLKGVDKIDSIAFNPSKWLMVHFDCTAMWVRNSSALHCAFNVNPLYLTHEFSGLAIDYMHWQIPLSKRFRSLKLWFVMRNYGVKGLQEHIRKGVMLAEKFETLVKSDPRFEVPARRHLGLVVFCLKGNIKTTEALLKRINSRGKIHCVPANLKGKYVIRFCIASPRTTVQDIESDWKEIVDVTNDLLSGNCSARAPEGNNDSFGSSLLLSNTPLSPTIVNGSFAALHQEGKVLDEFSKIISIPRDNFAMRKRVRGILMSGKKFSLDSRLDLFQALYTDKKLRTVKDIKESRKQCDPESLQFSEESTPVTSPKGSPLKKNTCEKCGHSTYGYKIKNSKNK
ncbi:unnamed protein product [Acanthoscelides obtectus]|nr:unnamed protein product [Acanthoscelides obtectus]CAK1632670.1 Histidine decarboxylase [Acanthoscelides obtectus]